MVAPWPWPLAYGKLRRMYISDYIRILFFLWIKLPSKAYGKGHCKKRIIAWFKFYVWKHLQIYILKGTVLQLIFFLKSGHYGAVVYFKELRKYHFLLYFCSKIYVFALQNYGAMQTSPHEITEPLFFAPQNHGDFILCPAKLWSNADFAPQNDGDIVTGAKNIIKFNCCLFFSNYFCKSLSFPRSLQPFGPLFKEKISFVTVPLNLKRG